MNPKLPVLDAELIAALDDALGAKRSNQLACMPGCTECCVGPFPINAADARRLRAGLDAVPAARAEAVRARARTQAASYGALPADTDALDAFFARHAAVSCPALDPATGTCDLYDWRPIACRTYGPPVRIGDEDLPPCRLCYVGASPEEVERGRVVVDPDGLEDRILDLLGDESETIVAFALLDE